MPRPAATAIAQGARISVDNLFDTAALEAGTQQAVTFLTSFHPNRDLHCVGIAPDGSVVAKSAGPEQIDGLAAWINAQQGRYNIYFTVNGLRPSFNGGKAKKADVVIAYALHVDIDSLDGLERLLSFPIRPSAIVFSGGGYQAFWMLAEPTTDLALVEQLNAALAKALGGDKCQNIDRVMRVAGTVNLPNKKKREAGRVPVMARVEEADWSRTHALADFAEVLSAGNATAPAPALPADQPLVPVRLAELPPAVSEGLLSLARLGDDAEHPRGSAQARFPSRSEAVWALSCQLARAGCSLATIAGVLINPEFGISASVLEKPNPRQYALRQAQNALEAVAEGWPDVNKTGMPRATWRNTILALCRLDLQFSYDLFRQQKLVRGRVLEDHQGEISDDGALVLRHEVMTRFGFEPRPDHIRDAVGMLCLLHAFHPIREMLDELVWDGVPRLETWLIVYLGADDTPLNRAIGRILLVAAVRRVRRPGAKFDQIVVLEGRQGTGKSTAIKILAGEGNHSDQEILTLPPKEQMEQMAGVWLYELSEIVGMSKAEVNKVKSFVSRDRDKARMSYGYFPVTRQRQTVFIGTTNEDQYLRDLTGNRRFWPVKTGTIDLEALAHDRDQLLAEAAHLEADDESIVLPEELWEAAAREQEARLEDDPWRSKLEAVTGTAAGDEVQVSTGELLEELGIAVEHQQQWQTKRIAGLMLSLGWKRDKFKRGKRTLRGFSRPKPADHVDLPTSRI